MHGTAVPSSWTTVPKRVRVAFCTSYRQIEAQSTSLATIGLPKLSSGSGTPANSVKSIAAN